MLRWMVPALAMMLTVCEPRLPPTCRPRRSAGPPLRRRNRQRSMSTTDPDALISPAYGIGSYIRNLPGTPLLPGSAHAAGYYGSVLGDYDYQGAYYGGKQVDLFLAPALLVRHLRLLLSQPS